MCCLDPPPAIGPALGKLSIGGLGPPPKPPWLKYTLSCNHSDPVYPTDSPHVISSQHASTIEQSTSKMATKMATMFPVKSPSTTARQKDYPSSTTSVPLFFSKNTFKQTTPTAPHMSEDKTDKAYTHKSKGIYVPKATAEATTSSGIHVNSTVHSEVNNTTDPGNGASMGVSSVLSAEMTAVICLGSLLALAACIILICWFYIMKHKRHGQINPERTAKYYNFLFNNRGRGRRWWRPDDTDPIVQSNRSSMVSSAAPAPPGQDSPLVGKYTANTEICQIIRETDIKEEEKETPPTRHSRCSTPLVRQDSSTSGISVGYTEDDNTLSRHNNSLSRPKPARPHTRRKKRPSPPSRNSSDSSTEGGSRIYRGSGIHSDQEPEMVLRPDRRYPNLGNHHFGSSQLPILQPIKHQNEPTLTGYADLHPNFESKPGRPHHSERSTLDRSNPLHGAPDVGYKSKLRSRSGSELMLGSEGLNSDSPHSDRGLTPRGFTPRSHHRSRDNFTPGAVRLEPLLGRGQVGRRGGASGSGGSARRKRRTRHRTRSQDRGSSAISTEDDEMESYA